MYAMEQQVQMVLRAHKAQRVLKAQRERKV
jgi:hypothetical protein